MSEPILATAHKTIPQIVPKACYVIELVSGKTISYFISLEKPLTEGSFISTKGFFCDNKFEEIIEKYADIIKDVQKEKVVEIMFPSVRINFIRSLVFKQK